MDVGVWKSVTQVNTTGNVTYSMLDGRYSTSITISNTWKIDLGTSYDVCSLVCDGSGSNFNVTTYNSSGAIVTVATPITSNPQIIPVQAGGFTSVQNTIGYGKRTRYITVTTAAVINFQTIAVIDSLGRNVAYNAYLYGSPPNTTLPNNLGASINISNSFIQIDLGQEYYISFVTIYYVTLTSTTLNGSTVTLKDATWNTTGTVPLVGTSYAETLNFTV